MHLNLQLLSIFTKYLSITFSLHIQCNSSLLTYPLVYTYHWLRIDEIYYAPDLESDAHHRKPNTGMGLQAKQDFPSIDFSKSVMVGNNFSDMDFGKRLGMKTVFVETTKHTKKKKKRM